MKTCKRCGSHAINPNRHGRESGQLLDLCDVCYWRAKYETLTELTKNILKTQKEINNGN